MNWDEIAKPFREAAKKTKFTKDDSAKLIEKSRQRKIKSKFFEGQKAILKSGKFEKV